MHELFGVTSVLERQTLLKQQYKSTKTQDNLRDSQIISYHNEKNAGNAEIWDSVPKAGSLCQMIIFGDLKIETKCSVLKYA